MPIRTCIKGHQFYKTSDCPTCPICERQIKPTAGFLAILAAPARRALENAGIQSLQQLSAYSEKEILSLHGMGRSSIPKLKAAMQQAGLDFRSDPVV